jgi:hypothetical protein
MVMRSKAESDSSVFPARRADVIIWSGGALLLFVGLMVLTFAFQPPSSVPETAPDFNRLLAIYEPSAVASLGDGRIVVAEDESGKPLHLLTSNATLGFQSEPLTTSLLTDVLSGKGKGGKLDDLEGMAVDGRDFIYAVTSHSRTGSGKREAGREKLIRFRVEGTEIADLKVFDGLFDVLAEAHRSLDKAARNRKVGSGEALNIEALGFDASGERLLVGLRSPVVDGHGLIIVIENPDDIFERGARPVIAQEPWFLDLEKGGIRGLVYDPQLEGHLIISRREDKKAKPFKLWFWNGDLAQKPQRVRIADVDNIERAEGITPILQGDARRLLIVFDDGNALRRIGAHYQIFDYDDLDIEPPRRY